MRMISGFLVSAAVLCSYSGVAQPVSAQQMGFPEPDRDQRFGPNRIGVDIGALAVSVSYSRQVSSRAEWGVAVSGGAQTGFMVGSSELTGDHAMPLFVELASAAAFVRGDLGERTELEGGARAGWLFHATEFETIFGGIYTSVQYRIGAARIGPRVYWGRISEESGRSETSFAVIPLTLGFRWSW